MSLFNEILFMNGHSLKGVFVNQEEGRFNPGCLFAVDGGRGRFSVFCFYSLVAYPSATFNYPMDLVEENISGLCQFLR